MEHHVSLKADFRKATAAPSKETAREVTTRKNVVLSSLQIDSFSMIARHLARAPCIAFHKCRYFASLFLKARTPKFRFVKKPLRMWVVA